jgi:hypothetical protein
MALTEAQIIRYSRHVLLPDVGGVGQSRLLAATVALDFAGADPATTWAATYLAAAGIGTLVLMNLDDATLPDRLTALNPDVRMQVRGTCSSGFTCHVPARAGATYLHAEALVRGGVAACAVIHRLARGDA